MLGHPADQVVRDLGRAATPGCRPTTATTDGGVARGGFAGSPAVRSRSATWRSTNRAAAGSSLDGLLEGLARQLADHRVPPGPHAGRARLAGQERELAEHLARPELADDPAAHLDLEAAATDDERRPGRVALAHQPDAGRHRQQARGVLELPRASAGRAATRGTSERSFATAATGRGARAGAGSGSGGSTTAGRCVGRVLLLRRVVGHAAAASDDERRQHEGDDREHPAVAERRRRPRRASARR